ncbi:hypothetical protein [Pontibacter ummariensis]|uniref:hypothetical protein n=1 Tax=Pontibacter ummariensis TaxID=1610492 RepID=UPI000B797989|nr:hypothetical protein [Pontibacter ummariensis]
MRRLIFFFFCFVPVLSYAQTEQDALMMGERQLCAAATISYNSWTNYWEGTFKRDNENMGRVSTRSAVLMVNYGITPKLNVLAAVPYVRTQASEGTLAGMDGVQDLSLFVKWKPWEWQGGHETISVFAVGGLATPSSRYNIDLLPMSIGLGSRVLSGRVIADVQVKQFTATLSAAYLHRSNVEIDRTAYYTDRLINSREVDMPNATNFQLRAGYRTPRLIAEAVVDNMTTLGGFDIRRNDMPFVSNRMNSTKVGVEGKYYLARHPALGFHAGAWHTLAGRNIGQATGGMAGMSYILDFTTNTIKD